MTFPRSGCGSLWCDELRAEQGHLALAEARRLHDDMLAASAAIAPDPTALTWTAPSAARYASRLADLSTMCANTRAAGARAVLDLRLWCDELDATVEAARIATGDGPSWAMY